MAQGIEEASSALLQGGAGAEEVKPSDASAASGRAQPAPSASQVDTAVTGTEASSSAHVEQPSCGGDGSSVGSGAVAALSDAMRAAKTESVGDSELGEFSSDEGSRAQPRMHEEEHSSLDSCKLHTVMTIRLRASRFSQELVVCSRVKIDAVLDHVAMLLSVTPHRLCLLRNGALVGTWRTVGEYAETVRDSVFEEDWLVATWPLSTSPKEYKLIAGPDVQLSSEVLSCESDDPLLGAQELDLMDDAVFQAALSESLLPEPETEQLMMYEHDHDVLTVQIRRQRDDFVMHCARGVLLETCAPALPRRRESPSKRSCCMRPYKKETLS